MKNELIFIAFVGGLAACGASEGDGARNDGERDETAGALVQAWQLPDPSWTYWEWDPGSMAEEGVYTDQIVQNTTRGETALLTKADTDGDATSDRIKIQLKERFGSGQMKPIIGTWEWRTYLPPVVSDEDISTGMFIYSNDTHEIDFECGWGSGNGWRSRAGATGNELVCGMTAQAVSPDLVAKVTADTFHTFRLEMTSTQAKFTIDGSYVGAIDLGYNPGDYTWRSIISAENLWWMGTAGTHSSNHAYTTQQYGPAFDYVQFTY